jgi:hypothetical protein
MLLSHEFLHAIMSISVVVVVVFVVVVVVVVVVGLSWQATNVLQPVGLLYRQLWTFKLFATRCPRAYRRVPHSAEVGTMSGNRTINFAEMLTSTVHLGIFYIPQICDMGPTALLPFQGKACLRIFRS